MAEDSEKIEGEIPPLEGGDDPEMTPGYQPPAQKSLDEIQNLDADDESLVKYKQQLLGQTGAIKDEGGSNVKVVKMILKSEGRQDIVTDLTGDLTKLKSKPTVIKEGAQFRIAIVFRVQREIVSGLRYHHVVSRKGIKVDKQSYMVGSYGPRAESHEYLTPLDDAPKGMIARGSYIVKSKFIDDDKNTYLEWEWSFNIKKDWE